MPPCHAALAIATFVCYLGTASSQTARTFTSAQDMQRTMDDEVKAIAVKLQKMYPQIYEAKESGCSASKKVMCDADNWDNAAANPDFNNPSTRTCVRRDRDTAGRLLKKAVGGRNLNPAVDEYILETDCTYHQVVMTCPGGDCSKSPAECSSYGASRNCKLNPVSQQDHLNKTGCTLESDKGKCVVDESQYGVSYTDKAMSAEVASLANLDICATNGVFNDGTFRSIKQKYPQTGWQFMGLQQTGVYRNWPAIHQCRTEKMCDGCSDPRFRGWYASAASGAKDLVLIMDTSGSMLKANRMNIAKKASKWVMNTLTSVDRVGVVDYDSTVKKFSNTLVPATQLNKHKMKLFIGDMSASGSTNMNAAFEAAFEIYAASTSTASTSGCSRVILFLTDGVNSNRQDLHAVIAAKNSGTHGKGSLGLEGSHSYVRIFTYAFGDDASGAALLGKIACDHGGVFHHIADRDSDNLKEIMAGYYVYLAAGIKIKPTIDTAATPFWAEPFEDGQGTGQLTASCARVYNFQKKPLELFGVVCLGISMKYASAHSDWTTTWAAMEKTRATCPDFRLSWEQLESLRGKQSCASIDLRATLIATPGKSSARGSAPSLALLSALSLLSVAAATAMRS